MPEQNSGTSVSVVENKALLELCSRDQVKKRFEQLLGGRNGAAFISSIISCANQNESLAKCRPESIVAAGVMAATVNLPVTPGLGWAAIVPYKQEAQFQIMKDGYVQLALRTGQYRSINCSDVYEDEFESWNPHTGTLKTTDQETWRYREDGKTDRIVGYLAFFELLNGFKKYSYWTIAQLEAHGKKYSQSYRYNKGLWADNKPAMYLKTPLKLLISHFGPMSTQMQYAVEYDYGTRKADGSIAYMDGREAIDVTPAPADLIPMPQRIEKPAKPAMREGSLNQQPITKRPPPPKPDNPVKPKEKPKQAGSRGPGQSHRDAPETKPFPDDSWEGPMAAMSVHDCQECADDIAVGALMYRAPNNLYYHAAHFQTVE